MLLLAIPLGALIARHPPQLYRTEGAPVLARLGWTMPVGLPFGLLMLVFALLGGSTDDPNLALAGSAFALGCLGRARRADRRGVPLPLPKLSRVPPRLRTVLRRLATLRPLGWGSSSAP